MPIQTDYSSSPDLKLNQFLRWDDTSQWIEVIHTINLSIGENVRLIYSKTYRHTDNGYDTLCTEFGINPGDQLILTEYKYQEIHGSIDSDYAVVLPSNGRPYYLGIRPHFVIARLYDINGNLTSTTSGTAL